MHLSIHLRMHPRIHHLRIHLRIPHFRTTQEHTKGYTTSETSKNTFGNALFQTAYENTKSEAPSIALRINIDRAWLVVEWFVDQSLLKYGANALAHVDK